MTPYPVGTGPLRKSGHECALVRTERAFVRAPDSTSKQKISARIR
jgi:hypothetical protein